MLIAFSDRATLRSFTYEKDFVTLALRMTENVHEEGPDRIPLTIMFGLLTVKMDNV